MPLLVTKDSAYTDYILPDLLKIVDGDTSLGDAPASDPAWISITYGGTKPGFAQSQLVNIVGTPLIILLRYVASDFVLPEDPNPATGIALRIANVQGVTYAPGAGNANPSGSGMILVYLDAYNDQGLNYWVRGADGSKIFSPRWVQLFHELSHALHIATGQVTDTTPDAVEDALTIGDENKLRSQYSGKHPWLKQRSPNEEGGPDAKDPEPDFNNPTPKSKCFLVATAAYGSTQAPQIQRLRRIRDLTLRSTPLGHAFFDALEEEYYRYSPTIADNVRQDDRLRRSIATLAVEPLLDFLSILETYVNGGWCRPDVEEEAQAVVRVRVRALRDQGITDTEIAAIAADMLMLCSAIQRGVAVKQSSSVDYATDATLDPIEYVSGVIRTLSHETTYTSWAIFRPLAIYWSAIRRTVRDTRAVDEPLTKDLCEWLRAVPLPPRVIELSETAMRHSLDTLTDAIFSDPRVREAVGAQLLRRCAHGAQYDLTSLLRQTDFA